MMIPVFRQSWKESQSSNQGDEPGSQPQKPQRYSGKPATFLWLTGFFERDLDFFLGTMEKCISLAGLPLPGRLGLTNYFESVCTIAQKRTYILSSMLLPSLSRVVMREASNQALLELATSALAVERFRLAEGRLPTNLKELTPRFLDTVPIEPFDGNPVRYRRLASGYVIYSVDADGHDDGGVEAPEHKKATDNSSYDITFIVER